MNYNSKSNISAPEPRYTVGVDMGGTGTAFAIVDSDGRIAGRGKVPTLGFDTPADFVTKLCEEIDRLMVETHLKDKVFAIGIGAPCANAVTGVIEAATDLPWPSPIPLARLVEEKSGLPVFISNDANAAAAGEMAYGAARGCNNFIMITLGTGVGAGVVCDGHLLSGSRGFAAELGHVTVSNDPTRPCGCGRNGCLQTYCSASGVVNTARRLLADPHEPSLLREIPEKDMTTLDIFNAAVKGDKIALRTFSETGRALGEAAANFAAFTDPDLIILFGGVANAGEFIIPAMREALNKKALHLYRDRIEILRSALPDADAALLGAASLPYLNEY